jgi:hypothetical protein
LESSLETQERFPTPTSGASVEDDNNFFQCMAACVPSLHFLNNLIFTVTVQKYTLSLEHTMTLYFNSRPLLVKSLSIRGTRATRDLPCKSPPGKKLQTCYSISSVTAFSESTMGSRPETPWASPQSRRSSPSFDEEGSE